MANANSKTASPSSRLRLRITAAAEKEIRDGHPWVFSNSVREQNRAGTAGELAVIFDRRDKFLAVGFFDPDSPIRVRILHVGKPLAIDATFWRARLEQALQKRTGLFDAQTTGYRLINGESDGWPGLVLDRYDEVLVTKIYTASWLVRRDEIIRLFAERLQPRQIVLRVSRNISEAAEKFFGCANGRVVFGEPLNSTPVFLETGLRFEADVLRGQKTGFFLDQRENRRIIEKLAPGRAVLNAFSFSGGFSVYAACGGAKSVTDLDISTHALESAKRNFALNEADGKISGCIHRSIQADAFNWLEKNSEQKFDLIILDPPSLAKREAERAGAIRAYTSLIESAVGHLLPEGILAACSCSAHVSAEEFFQAVRRGVSKSRRGFVELQTTGHAPDHPAEFPEAKYLKAIFLRIA